MSLIHWWPLNGNLKDYGTLNTPLTNINSTAVNNNGKIGKCYYFNGSSNALRAEYPNTTKPTAAISLAGWYKAVSLNVSHYIISCYESGGVGLAGGTGNVNFQLYYNGDYVRTIVAVPDTEWHHWCGTFDGRYLKLYMDGVLKATNDMGSGDHPISYHSTTSWMIGANPYNGDPAGNYTNGYINDVRIYDHALSQKEVKELSKGLVLHYNFEDEYAEGTTNLAANVAVENYVTKEVATYATSVKGKTLYGNNIYTFSVYIKNDSDHALAARVSGYKTNDSDYSTVIGNYIQSGHEGLSKVTIDLTNTSNFNGKALLYIQNGTSGTIPTNKTFYIKHVQFEQKDHATPFVNGTRAAGTIYDSSGYGNNSTTVSNITITEDSKIGQYCANFDGSSSYVMCPKLEFMNKAITVNVWAKASSWITTSAKKLISCTESGGWQITLTSDSKLKFYPYINGSYRTADVAESTLTDTWHMITGVYDGSNVKLYVDGVQVATTAVTGSITYGNAPVTIGAEPNTSTTSVSGDYFNGKIGDVKIFSTALSAADILAEYKRKASIDRNGNLFTGEFVAENGKTNISKTGVVESSHFVEGTSVVKLVDGYTELEYIGLSGAQQIDTGTKFNMQSGSCEITFQASTTSQNGMLIASTNSNYFWLYYYNNANKINLYVYASGQKVIQGDAVDLNKHTIEYKNKHMYIDSVDKGSFTVTLSETTGNVYIGSYGGNYFFQGKVFSCRLYDGDNNLIRNFIPAKRNKDNVIGMYDTVNRVFYTNSGTGTFTAGPEKGNLSIVYSNELKEC